MAVSDFNIPDQTPRAQYIAAPGQKDFPIPFRFFDGGDIYVSLNSNVNPEDQNSYTVVGERENATGTLSFLVGLAGGEIVTIFRQSPFERIVNFQNSGEWTADNVNDQLNRVVTYIQEVALRSLDLAVVLPITTQLTSLVFPDFGPAQNANRVITWSPDGTKLTNGPTITEITAITVAIPAITAVSQHLDEIDAVANIDTEIVGVYAIRDEVVSAYTIRVPIVEIYNNMSELLDVHGQLSSVVNVSNNMSSVVNVSNNMSELLDVHGQLSSVINVSNNIAAVVNADGNMAAIVDAPNQATAAANSALAAANSASSINMPSAVGEGLNFPRQKADETGFEYRTAAQVRSDIGAATSAQGVKADTALQPTNKATKANMIAEASNKYPDAAILKNHPGIAKAWVKFNGTGTPAIDASYNVSSITDVGAGDYLVNFTNNFSSANYIMNGAARFDNGSGGSNCYVNQKRGGTQSASQCQVSIQNNSGSFTDPDRVFVTFFGELA